MSRRLSLSFFTAAILLSVISSAFASTHSLQGASADKSASPAQPDDIIKIKRDVLISKDMVVNDVIVIHGSATVYGRVDGNVVIVGGSLYLKGDARLSGHAVIIGGEIVRDSSAQIAGKTTQIYIPRFLPSLATFLTGGWIAVWTAISVMALLGFLGLAILMVAMIPSHVGAAVTALERHFAVTFLWGVFWVIMIAPVAVLLAISIVGIILIPLEIILAALAFLTGYIASATYIGKKIFISFKKESPLFVCAILGILMLYALGYVPFFGAVIKALFLIAGFGAVVVTRFGTVR